jgi:LuxR family maltose regulon positive regulatory protein
VRELIAQQACTAAPASCGWLAALGRMLVGLSHCGMAIRLKRKRRSGPSLAEAEAENRRGMIACLHASVVAARLLEQDQLAAAQAVLANRLDVIERCGFPDIILCAYRTLSRIALGQGDSTTRAERARQPRRPWPRRELPRCACIRWPSRCASMPPRLDGTVDKLLRRIDELAGQFEHEATLPLQPNTASSPPRQGPCRAGKG